MKTPLAQDVKTCMGLVTLLLLLCSFCHTNAHVHAEVFKAQRRLLEKDNFQSCLSNIGAKILHPGTLAYEASRKKVWNQATLHHPAAIVLATTYTHVQKAVKCGAEYRVAVSPRSGGHSYEGYGTGGRDGVLVVDLAGLAQFSYDSASMTAHIGPGLRLGQVYYKLWTAGKVTIPAGTCPTVGVGGHALGGGWGLLARKYGVAVDSILEVLVVTSTGELVKANKYRNSDLFRALKGAGHNNYGIVVDFKFRVYDVSAKVTLFVYSFAISDLVPVMKVFEEMSKTAPAEITGGLQQNATLNLLSGICLLEHAECKAKLEQYLAGTVVPLPGGTLVAPVYHIQTVLNFAGLPLTADPAVLNTSGDLSPEGGYIKAKDLIVKGDGLTDEGIQAFVDYLLNGTGLDTFTLFDMFGPNAHTNNLKVKRGDGWVHRDTLYGMQILVNYTRDPKNPGPYLSYMDGWQKTMQPYAAAESFQNTIDVDLPIRYYYKRNLKALEETKCKWDYGNVFRYNQSIPVKNCDWEISDM